MGPVGVGAACEVEEVDEGFDVVAEDVEFCIYILSLNERQPSSSIICCHPCFTCWVHHNKLLGRRCTSWSTHSPTDRCHRVLGLIRYR